MTPGWLVALGAAVGALVVGAAVVLVASGNDDTSVGTISVTVATDGMPPTDASFRVRVACTKGRREVERRVLTFDAESPRTQVVQGIPLPARCTVTQTEGAGATLVEYASGDRRSQEPPSFELNATARTEARVAVTNSFPSSTAVGTLVITKEVTGSPSGAAGYVVRVTCEGGFEADVELPAAGGTEVVPITLDPAGTTCALEETERGGAIDVQYSPSQTGITLDLDAPTLDVTITNRFR